MIRMSKFGLWRQTMNPRKPVCYWEELHHWVAVTPNTVKWVGTGKWKWRCDHEEGCDRCGKILDGLFGVGQRCPDYHEREA
jgi:hypothetical protein